MTRIINAVQGTGCGVSIDLVQILHPVWQLEMMFLSISNITTGYGNDNILGSDGNNEIASGAGDDVITGGLGDDTIDGNEGADVAVFAGVRVITFTSSEDGLTVTVTDRSRSDFGRSRM